MFAGAVSAEQLFRQFGEQIVAPAGIAGGSIVGRSGLAHSRTSVNPPGIPERIFLSRSRARRYRLAAVRS